MIKSAWYPAVDVREKPDQLVLTAELPGIDDKDVDIEIDGNVLALRGRRTFEKETREEGYLHVERSYGSFCRAFTLPPNAATDKIKAEHEDGLLRIMIPKRPELKPTRAKTLKPAKARKGK